MISVNSVSRIKFFGGPPSPYPLWHGWVWFWAWFRVTHVKNQRSKSFSQLGETREPVNKDTVEAYIDLWIVQACGRAQTCKHATVYSCDGLRGFEGGNFEHRRCCAWSIFLERRGGVFRFGTPYCLLLLREYTIISLNISRRIQNVRIVGLHSK